MFKFLPFSFKHIRHEKSGDFFSKNAGHKKMFFQVSEHVCKFCHIILHQRKESFPLKHLN